MRRFYWAVHQVVENNTDPLFDHDPSNSAFDIRHHAEYMAFLACNLHSFYSARCVLTDAESREVFDKVVLFRLLSHFHFKIAEASLLDWQNKVEAREVLLRAGDQPLPFGDGGVYQIEVGGGFYTAQGTAGMLGHGFFGGQYAYQIGDACVFVRRGDCVIDGGAYIGDTALPFADAVGEGGKVYAFEPSFDSVRLLRENLDRNPQVRARVEVFPCGLSDHDHGGGMMLRDGALPWARLKAETLVYRLDTLVEDGVVDRPVDFVKLDVEGSELAALQGMERMLLRDRPYLAICVYHQPQDLYVLPLYLNSHLPGYHWYLNHHSIRIDETVLYGEPT